MWGTFKYMPPVMSQAWKAESMIRLCFTRLTGYSKRPHPAQGLHVGTVKSTQHISIPTLGTQQRALEYIELSSIKYVQINVNSK